MHILPFQTEIAQRMLINTEDENIHPDAQFIQTSNGYWLAWHDGTAAMLAPNTPPDIPCFWVEGAHNLEELISMVENGEFDELEEFDGNDDAWHQAATTCHESHQHEHNHTCGCHNK